MSLLIGFLTFFMVMNCLFLMLLILIQLPKKEAGAGIAFGGAATDALFGAGSGNALTKLTKYSATVFVGLALMLSVLNMNAARQGSRMIEQELSRQASAPVQPIVTPPAPAPGTTVPTVTNVMTFESTNPVTAAPSTAAPAEAPEAPAVPPATQPQE
ncbi:MAG: preprotein translocase subunit SecG [Verrucomicrobiia bacterium]